MNWEQLIEHRAAQAIAEVRLECQIARLDFGRAPRIYTTCCEGPLPDTMRCIHCGGRLQFSIDAWEIDGTPDEVGFHCPREIAEILDEEEPQHPAFGWWDDHAMQADRALRWCRRWIRRID